MPRSLSLMYGLVAVTVVPLVYGADKPLQRRALTLISQDTGKSSEASRPNLPTPVSPSDDPPIFTHPQPAASEAAEQRSVSEPTAAPSPGEAEQIVAMPKMEIQADKLSIVKAALLANEWAFHWEQRLSEPGEFDSVLNKFHLPLFGGSTAAVRAGEAAARVRLLEFERKLIIAIGLSSSEEDKTALTELLAEIRSMRRGYGYGDTFRTSK